jgi:hypothetical protein
LPTTSQRTGLLWLLEHVPSTSINHTIKRIHIDRLMPSYNSVFTSISTYEIKKIRQGRPHISEAIAGLPGLNRPQPSWFREERAEYSQLLLRSWRSFEKLEVRSFEKLGCCRTSPRNRRTLITQDLTQKDRTRNRRTLIMQDLTQKD